SSDLRNAMVARNARGTGDGGRVMPVDVQHLAASDLLRSDVGRIQRQTIRAMPEDGALAGRLVNDDVGALIGATGAQFHVVEVHPGFSEAGHLDPSAFVVAHRSDV